MKSAGTILSIRFQRNCRISGLPIQLWVIRYPLIKKNIPTPNIPHIEYQAVPVRAIEWWIRTNKAATNLNKSKLLFRGSLITYFLFFIEEIEQN
jgi:hypothetical protein